MSKARERELTRVHIWLDPDDIEWIDNVFGETLGRSLAIRQIIKKYRKTIDEKANQKASALGKLELEI